MDVLSFALGRASSKDTANNENSDEVTESDTQPQPKNPFDELSDEENNDNEGTPEDVISKNDEKALENSLNPFGEDPLINDMERHWQELSDLLESSLTDPFALQELKEHLKAIAEILDRELSQLLGNGRTTECLEYFLSENMFEKVYLFSTQQRLYCSEVRLTLLNFSTALLSCSGPPLFIHQQILRPLKRLLRACENARDSWLDASLVGLLQTICILIQANDSLLELFFTAGSGKVPSKFLVFSLLINYMHHLTEAGMRARDAMLLCLSIAGRSPHSSLCDFIITDTEFCQVLATGLSATYSQLPLTITIQSEEWESPLAGFEQHVPEIKKFMQALSYCNSVLQMAPLLVSQVCVRLIKNGFLQQVLGPALSQISVDEATTATGYLTLFLLNISNVQLMRTFLQFIMTDSHDGVSVLTILIQNISSDFKQLSSITLELFNVLLDLNCEDVILELVLKYLLSGKHVMISQIPTISSRDMYGVASRKFLSLVPSCCVKAEKLLLDSVFQSPHSSRSSTPPPAPPSIVADSSSCNSTPNSKTGLTRRDSTSSASSLTSSTSTLPNHTHPMVDSSSLTLPGTPQQSSLLELINLSIMPNVLTPEMAYQSYLSESKAAIVACARACKCWSSTYNCCINNTNDADNESGLVTDSNSAPNLDPNLPVIQSITSPSHQNVESTMTVGDPPTPSPSISPNLSPRVTRKSIKKRSDLCSHIRFNDSTGIFLKTVLERLSQLFKNPPIINLLLLKIVTKLCHYPQPLLRSLLLNHQLVLKPGVPNLFSVLQDLKQTIDRVDRERDGFELRLARAMKTMIYKAAVKNGEVDGTIAKKIAALMEATNRPESRLSEQSEYDHQSKAKDDTPPLQRRRARTEGSQGLEKLRKRKKTKVSIEMVYAILLISEFVKELSALSLEHAAINPELLMIDKPETTTSSCPA